MVTTKVTVTELATDNNSLTIIILTGAGAATVTAKIAIK